METSAVLRPILPILFYATVLAFTVAKAEAAPGKLIYGKLVEQKMTEDQIFATFTQNVWENWPVKAASYVVEKGSDEDFQVDYHRIPDNVSLSTDGTFKLVRPGAKDDALTFVSKWNFKKTGPASGIIFLQSGDALRFAFLQDGSVSIGGNRYWKGAPKSSRGNRKALPSIPPSALYTKLTGTDWYEACEISPAPLIMHFGLDGTYSERQVNPTDRRTADDASFAPLPYWSLETVPKTKIVFHQYGDLGYPLLAQWNSSNLSFPKDPDVIYFHMPGYLRTMTRKHEVKPPYELTETQMYEILSSNTWKNMPKSATKSDTTSQAQYYDNPTDELIFSNSKVQFNRPLFKKSALHVWSLKKDHPNGGWIFLENGGAIKFFIFRDGTISVSGIHYYPWDKKEKFSHPTIEVSAGPTFQKLTRTIWEQPNDFNGGPRTVTFGADGHYTELQNGKHVEPKHFFSLNSFFEPASFVLHDLDDAGMNFWTNLSWHEDALLMRQATLIPRPKDPTIGLLYGGGIGNMSYKLTYKRPLQDKAKNKLHFEFTRHRSGDNAFISLEDLDKINVIQSPLDSAGNFLPNGGTTPSIIDLKGLPDKTPKSGDIEIYFDKAKPMNIRLFVRPKHSFKTSISDDLRYQP